MTNFDLLPETAGSNDKKILPDGSVAALFVSASKNLTTLYIHRPSGSQDIKIRYPSDLSDPAAESRKTKYKCVRELEAWSKPGNLLHPEYGKNMLQQELWEKGVSQDVFLGLSEIPGESDCKNLNLSIQSGELTEYSFKRFCLSYGLSDSMQSKESAAKFLEYMEGRLLAWIHLPIDADPTLLPLIVKIISELGHIVIDPDNMTPIN
ncbi:hypothetical protein [Verminephrobacter aporrectodeae]|nr:hypothetical protein [Verminephrobacter aporrectodeae]